MHDEPIAIAETVPGTDRTAELRALMRERILVLDGATGTMLQSKNLTAEDFGGPELDGCNENLVFTRPDVILSVHHAYLGAGADIIETNTFGGTPLVLAEYGLEDRALEMNRRAAELARQAAAEAATPGRPRFVAGSIGPTTKAISVTGGITFEGLVATFREQALGLLEGGADLFFIETVQDTRNAKAALIAVESVLAAAAVRRPIVISGTIEATGTMLAGQTADAFVASMAHADALAVGLNCATGPEFMSDHIRTIHEMGVPAVSCFPNAGLPDEDGRYGETPDSLAAALERFVDNGWLNIVGGCCGTTDAHVQALADMADGKAPRQAPAEPRQRSYYSGIELVEATDDNRPLLVGERTNVIGSRRFKRLVAEEKWDEAAEIARLQVKSGAQIVDVCLQSTERDEIADSRHFYERLIRSVKVPLMIDTTDPEAVAVALTYSQGKAIVNSINLEDGEDKFELVCPLLAEFGAAVVVGTIDEDPVQAQAFTRERKAEVARRSHALLTRKYGLREEDLVFDPLVFPAASGDAAYVGGAVETIEGLRLIKQALPACKTILGVSNVSFGLPPAAREVVNSVFLYHATLAGLDLAIVNSQGIERFASIPDDERQMAEDLLFNRPPEQVGGDETEAEAGPLVDAPADWREQSPGVRSAINRLHITRLTERYRGEKRAKKQVAALPLDERLAAYIVEGTRDGLIDDLQRKLDEGAAPLDVINGPLMDGMAEVGRLFNTNQLIVAEVLQSAESMKAAVSFLEQFMEASQSATRGKVILATVKGDVHDIGKNLVEIIFSNNGYEVVNLGIKVPPDALIRAYREHAPDAIGLSGLLVKSAHQMVVTAEDLAAAGISAPILVGGAALSEKFTRGRIAPAYDGPVLYCADAMSGLGTLHRLMDPGQRASLAADAAPVEAPVPSRARGNGAPTTVRSSQVRLDLAPLPPPYPERKVLPAVPHLTEIWSYVNPQMLFGKHMGFQGHFVKRLTERDPKALKLRAVMDEVQEEVLDWMRVSAVWRYYEATSDGNAVALYEPGRGEPTHAFTFPRQAREDGLCLADYIVPVREGVRDSLAVFVVGAGEGVRAHAERAKAAGEYVRSHAIQALALETAEAAAEWLHRRLREAWGFPDPAELTMNERLKARYRGKRYSFGYPACPDLEDQAGIWKLLEPDEIGVRLTDGMMMEPEASVSALVFHHPDAKYFSAVTESEESQPS